MKKIKLSKKDIKTNTVKVEHAPVLKVQQRVNLRKGYEDIEEKNLTMDSLAPSSAVVLNDLDIADFGVDVNGKIYAINAGSMTEVHHNATLTGTGADSTNPLSVANKLTALEEVDVLTNTSGHKWQIQPNVLWNWPIDSDGNITGGYTVQIYAGTNRPSMHFYSSGSANDGRIELWGGGDGVSSEINVTSGSVLRRLSSAPCNGSINMNNVPSWNDLRGSGTGVRDHVYDTSSFEPIRINTAVWKVKDIAEGVGIAAVNNSGVVTVSLTGSPCTYDGPYTSTSDVANPVNGIFYLIGANTPYDIYAFINAVWVEVGTTSVVLTNYYTKAETDQLLSDQAATTTTEINTVQASLLADLASTAQSLQSNITTLGTTTTAQITSLQSAINTTYLVEQILQGNNITLTPDPNNSKVITIDAAGMTGVFHDNTLSGTGVSASNQLKVTNPFTPANYYLKTDTYNKTEVYSKSEVYSKTEAYSKAETYNKTETYTQTAVNQMITAVQNTFSSYYTKQQIDNTYKVKDIGAGVHITILPDPNDSSKLIISNSGNTMTYDGPYASTSAITNPSSDMFYLVGTAAPYDIYAYISSTWVDIGTTSVVLTNYYTKTEADAAITSAINTLSSTLTAAINTAVAAIEQEYKVTELVAGTGISIDPDSTNPKKLTINSTVGEVTAQDIMDNTMNSLTVERAIDVQSGKVKFEAVGGGGGGGTTVLGQEFMGQGTTDDPYTQWGNTPVALDPSSVSGDYLFRDVYIENSFFPQQEGHIREEFRYQSDGYHPMISVGRTDFGYSIMKAGRMGVASYSAGDSMTREITGDDGVYNPSDIPSVNDFDDMSFKVIEGKIQLGDALEEPTKKSVGSGSRFCDIVKTVVIETTGNDTGNMFSEYYVSYDVIPAGSHIISLVSWPFNWSVRIKFGIDTNNDNEVYQPITLLCMQMSFDDTPLGKHCWAAISYIPGSLWDSSKHHIVDMSMPNDPAPTQGVFEGDMFYTDWQGKYLVGTCVFCNYSISTQPEPINLYLKESDMPLNIYPDDLSIPGTPMFNTNSPKFYYNTVGGSFTPIQSVLVTLIDPDSYVDDIFCTCGVSSNSSSSDQIVPIPNSSQPEAELGWRPTSILPILYDSGESSLEHFGISLSGDPYMQHGYSAPLDEDGGLLHGTHSDPLTPWSLWGSGAAKTVIPLIGIKTAPVEPVRNAKKYIYSSVESSDNTIEIASPPAWNTLDLKLNDWYKVKTIKKDFGYLSAAAGVSVEFAYADDPHIPSGSTIFSVITTCSDNAANLTCCLAGNSVDSNGIVTSYPVRVNVRNNGQTYVMGGSVIISYL